MKKSARYGYPGNPVIGVAAPEGFEWKIVGKWPHVGAVDTLPETDQETPQPPPSHHTSAGQ